LRPDYAPVAVVPVAHIPAKRSQEENRDLAAETENAKQDRRVGHPVNEPELRGRLHPCPDQRDQLASEEELKIAVF
jgi:hypothetical protein